MKILSVKFQNLNSLEDIWHISFSEKAVDERGMILITGPTGAGKSTILDAITLALYGRTPRLPTISQSDNAIITKGAYFCDASVTFEVDDGKGPVVYTANWYQQRSGKHPEKFYSPKVELWQGDKELLADKKRDFDRLIEEITGLDYQRFVSSMLLPQGQFAEFLKASGPERAQILEKITGTQIYSELGVAVHKAYGDQIREKDRLLAQRQ